MIAGNFAYERVYTLIMMMMGTGGANRDWRRGHGGIQPWLHNVSQNCGEPGWSLECSGRCIWRTNRKGRMWGQRGLTRQSTRHCFAGKEGRGVGWLRGVLGLRFS